MDTFINSNLGNILKISLQIRILQLVVSVKHLFQCLAIRVYSHQASTYCGILQENVGVRCTLSDTNLKLVTCDVGNPLPAGDTVKFALRLSPAGVNGSSEYLQFSLHANR